jgi:hypothetical protein
MLGGDSFEQNLLRAAARARPPDASRLRVARSLGLAAAAATLTTSTSAAGASAAAGTKWGAAAVAIKGSLLGLAGISAVALATTGDARLDKASLRTEVSTVARTAPKDPAAQSMVPPAEPSSGTSVVPPEPAAAPSGFAARGAIRSSAAVEGPPHADPPKASTLARETAALDVARAAIRGGDPARGIRVLDSYDREFPRGMLASESRVLRIEALSRTGNRASARALGEEFLRAQPHHPLSARVRELSGGP